MVNYKLKLTRDNVDEIIDKIEFSDPQVDAKYSNVSIRMSIADDKGQKHPLRLETPWMKAVFGVSSFEAVGSKTKHKLPVSFDRLEDYERQQVFKEFFEKLDKKLIDTGFENAGLWLKRAGEPKAVIKAFYSQCLVYSKDKSGNISDKYPPRLQFKIPSYQNEDGSERFVSPVYTSANGKNPIESTPIEAIGKGASVKAIVECTGIWVINGKFGMGWRADMFKLKEEDKQQSYEFVDSEEDEDEDEDEEEQEAEQLAEEEEEAEEEQELEAEEEEEAHVSPVKPKKKTTRRTGRKKKEKAKK
jgi:hypothetical protein